MPAAGLRLRRAESADLPALLELEQAFASDRLSRRAYARLVSRDSAEVWVADEGGRVVGAVVLLFRRGFHAARLYSLAVAADRRGRGIGARLLERAEAVARERGCVSMRLEVREDNEAAIALYRRHGFEVVGRTAEYYGDGSAALRMRLRLVVGAATIRKVPYYPQSLEFTCGPAALMMALAALGWDEPLDRKLELALWREATTVFLQAGHGGCSPHGLAVAALRRGFAAEIVRADEGVPFLDSVRSPSKQEVIALSHETFAEQFAALGGVERCAEFTFDDVVQAVDGGGMPLLLLSGYRLYGKKVPHWVVVTGFDDDHLYVHDPFLPHESERADGVHLPLARSAFPQVTRFGRAGHRYLVILRSLGKARG